MARSYKKTPGWTNSGTDSRRQEKKAANTSVRRYRFCKLDADEDTFWDLPNGSFYKKISDSWDIHDDKWIFYTKAKYRKYVEKIWKDFEEYLANTSKYNTFGRYWPKNENEVLTKAGHPRRK